MAPKQGRRSELRSPQAPRRWRSFGCAWRQRPFPGVEWGLRRATAAEGGLPMSRIALVARAVVLAVLMMSLNVAALPYSSSVGPENGSALTARLPVAAMAKVTRVQADCMWPPTVRPRRIILTCADGGDRYRRLRWRWWGPFTARAVGRELVNDCDPSCTSGTIRSYRVRVTLRGVWRTDDYRVFHRARYAFTGSHKPVWMPWRGHRSLPPYH